MPNAQEMMVYQTWAKNAVDSQMYRSVGKESGIMMIMLAAREYGIGPAQALNGGLHIIEGKVELSARVMSALIRRAGHRLQIIESTDKKCVIRGKRSDTGEEHTAQFTIEEAQLAGLVKEKGGWKKAPTDMLYARTISRLARQLFSDCIGIGYIEGEISDSEPFNAEIRPSLEYESNEMDLIKEINMYFEPVDHQLLGQFIVTVMNHYKWSKIKTIEEMLKDINKTQTRFTEWKNSQLQS